MTVRRAELNIHTHDEWRNYIIHVFTRRVERKKIGCCWGNRAESATDFEVGDLPGKEGYMFGSLGNIALAGALVGITVIGIVTLISEGLRESRWKENMGWLPNRGTYIYELKSGQKSKAFNFDGSCYRVRAYPHGNDITTLHHEYGSWRKLTRVRTH